MARNVRKVEEHGYYELHPKPEADELKKYYESRYYDPLRKSGSGKTPEEVLAAVRAADSAEDRAWRKSVEHADIAHYLDALAPGRRVLDIGAGIGEVVANLAESGFEALGIEPSEEAGAFARAQGIPIIAADIAAFSADATRRGAFDAALLMNVLEHVLDPRETLARVRDLLAPGGVLMVRSPNDFSAIQHTAVEKLGVRRWWIADPDHVSYFSHASLARLLAASGFEARVSTCDFPIDWFLLMGRDYISDPALGRGAHEMRRNFELALDGEDRRRIYEALAAAGCGRNLIVYARKT